MKPSQTDEALLSLLREDARMPTAAIARRLQLSRTTVQSRIERLERNFANPKSKGLFKR
jgi:DNA-binding Lrp family transcriptional regulator